MEGWIKLHRKMISSKVFDNEKLLKVWLWCLIKATHKNYEQLVGTQLIKLRPGQFIFGRAVASSELKMSESTVYRNIKLLEKLKNIETKTNNKFSVISIVNWDLYQTDNESANNKWTTNEQQMNNKWTQTRTKEQKNVYLFNNKESSFDIYDSDKDFQNYLKSKGINNKQQFNQLSYEEQEKLSEKYVIGG